MASQQQKSWFSRNWLWFIPVSGCLGIILLFVFGIGAAIFGFSHMINNAPPIEYALEQANDNEEGPCCSPGGWCGNSGAHCDCETCIDYSEWNSSCKICLLSI